LNVESSQSHTTKQEYHILFLVAKRQAKVQNRKKEAEIDINGNAKQNNLGLCSNIVNWHVGRWRVLYTVTQGFASMAQNPLLLLLSEDLLE
jgi:hypothetical protein